MSGTTVQTFRPSDPAYDALRRGWNAAVEHRPIRIARPQSTAQVAAAVAAANRDGVRIAVAGTGHNSGPLGDLSDAVLIRTDCLRSVAADPITRRVRTGGGARWRDVVDVVAPLGLSVLHGSSPTVGVAGYSTGGGVGWYARSFGLAAHHLTGAELVTPDGSVLRVSDHDHPDLMWALRGGGAANFGVVTELEFDALPFDNAYAGVLAWDESAAEKVLDRWSTWAAEAPDTVTTSFRVLGLPPIDAVPAQLRGRRMILVDGAVLATDPVAHKLIGPLRELNPEIDTFARVPSRTLTTLHMDPEEPLGEPLDIRTTMLDAMSPTAVDAFLSAAGPGSGSTMMIAELRQFGGALARPAPHAALSHLPGGFGALFGGMYSVEQVRSGATEPAATVDAMRPWATGGSYLNFVEQPTDAATAFTPDAWARLQRVRATYDPRDTMRAVHPIPLP